MLTQDEIKKYLNYNPETGIFIWLCDRGIRKTKGKIAGSKFRSGYILIKINDIFYPAHRLAWIYMFGSEPLEFIDHINRIKDDNRICNLREASRIQNGYNREISSNNTSGIKGISWCSHHKRWVARVGVNKIRKCIGYFKSINDAESAIVDARKKYHGEFEYHAKA